MSHLGKEKLEQLKKLLMQERERVLNRARDPEALALAPEDLADETDHAAAVIQQGVELNAQERDRHMLREIAHALSKFEMGTYGLCEETEEPIDFDRLRVQPWARYCVEVAEARERKAKRYAKGA